MSNDTYQIRIAMLTENATLGNSEIRVTKKMLVQFSKSPLPIYVLALKGVAGNVDRITLYEGVLVLDITLMEKYRNCVSLSARIMLSRGGAYSISAINLLETSCRDPIEGVEEVKEPRLCPECGDSLVTGMGTYWTCYNCKHLFSVSDIIQHSKKEAEGRKVRL